MTPRGIALLAALLLAGCAGQDGLRSDTARMPLNAGGGPRLNETEAIALAGWALHSPETTAGNPARAASAIAAEDWLAGQDLLSGQFGSYAPVEQEPWNALRSEARAAIGVAPDAPSQVLIDRLFAAADALEAGNTEAARAQLADPIFTLGPQRTLAALAKLPPLPASQWAFADLARNDDRSTGAPKGMIRF